MKTFRTINEGSDVTQAHVLFRVAEMLLLNAAAAAAAAAADDDDAAALFMLQHQEGTY